jgi:CrcB protein
MLADRAVADRIEMDFPLGTLLVNLSGSLLLGLLAGAGLAHHLPATLEALLGTGFCGAYTTFSTWSYETVRLLEEGELLAAFGNVALSLAGGLVAAAAGIALGLAAWH